MAWRRFTGYAIVFLIVADVITHARRAAAAQPATAAVRARAIELVDERGRTRALLDVQPGGKVLFRLWDSTGTIRFKLEAGTAGSGIVLMDNRTDAGIQLLATSSATSVILRRDAAERVLVAGRR